jgi:hypothetical protein
MWKTRIAMSWMVLRKRSASQAMTSSNTLVGRQSEAAGLGLGHAAHSASAWCGMSHRKHVNAEEEGRTKSAR